MRRLDFLDSRVLAGALFAIALLTFVHLEHTFGFVASGLLGAALLVLGAVALILLGVAALLKSKALLVIGTYSILAIVLSSVLGSLLVRTQERLSFRRGDSVAAALASYHDAAMRYPETLSELVPAQLEAVPPTLMGVFRRIDFDYSVASAKDDYYLGFVAPGWVVCHRRGVTPEWVCDD